MTYEPPEHARLYVDIMRVLPAPGDILTVEAHHVIVELLHEDLDARRKAAEDCETTQAEPEPEKEPEPERPKLTAGSHLADSSKAGWTPQPDTYVFGFGHPRRRA